MPHPPDPWDILVRGGLPLAGRPAGGPPSVGELAGAVRDVLRTGAPGIASREGEALRAFLIAWRQHWPTSFAAAFGAADAAVADWAAWGEADRDRILKLRRIALARLAALL